MANRTDVDAATIHGTNPQNLVEKIIRSKIYESMFWKEHCFALNAETIVDRTMELKAVGGTYGGARLPSNFMCLVLKLLQIQPDPEIIREYILQEDSKYLRLLGAFYLRLTGKADQVYRYLEPLYNDLRKVRQLRADGGYELTHLDTVAEAMLHRDYLFDIALPRLPKRNELEDMGMLGPRVSGLDASNIAKMTAAIADEKAELQKQLEEHKAAHAAIIAEQRKEVEAQAAERAGERAERGRTGGSRAAPSEDRRQRSGSDTYGDDRDGGGRLRFKDGDRLRDTARGRGDRDSRAERDRKGNYGEESDEDDRWDGHRDRGYDRGGERDYARGRGDRDRDDRDGYRRRDRDSERSREHDRERDRDRDVGRSGRYARGDRDDYSRDRGDSRRVHRERSDRERSDRGDYNDGAGDRGDYRRSGRSDKERDRDDGRSQAEKDRAGEKRGGGRGGKKDGAEQMSVEETNKLRAELGLPPLK